MECKSYEQVYWMGAAGSSVYHFINCMYTHIVKHFSTYSDARFMDFVYRNYS